MALEIEQACCLSEPLRVFIGKAASGGVRVHVDAFRWQGPAAVVQGLGAPWNTLGFSGRLNFSAQHLELHQVSKQWQFSGTLSAAAESIASRLAPLDALGSYRLDIEGANNPLRDPLRLTLATTKGPLRLEGEGCRTPTGVLSFSGEAYAEAGAEVALAHVLRLIGNRNGPIALRVRP